MAKLANTEGVKRTDSYAINPELCIIITDPEHPRYDLREKLPIKEELILNIMEFGVKTPILITRQGDQFEVVDGRQRVRAAIEANKRLKKAGGITLRVPAVYDKAKTDADLFSSQVITNEHRQQDGILAKLAKVNRLRKFEKSTQEIANVFGVSKVAITQWEKLNDICAEVADAIDAGQLSASAAAALSGLKVPDQKAKLASLVAGGGKITAKKAAKAAKGDTSTANQRVSTAILKDYRDDPKCPDDVRDVLAWVLGESSTPPFELSKGDEVNGL